MQSLACPDWEDRIRTGKAIIPPLPLDQIEADRAVGIFNKLRIPDVVGTPTFGGVGRPWFREIVAALFGSYNTEECQRFLREVFVLVAKKNGKTSAGAALLMTALLMNRRPRAEFLFIGPTQAVAELAYGQAIGMIDADHTCQRDIDGQDGFLKKRLKVQDHIKTITDLRTNATLKIKSFDSQVLTGVKPVGALVDELHEIGKMPRANKIIGQLRGGIISQPEGFLVIITTQSDDPPQGVFRAELIKAREIRDGKRVGTMLPVLYEFPPAMMKSGEWKESKNWGMVNPNINISIPLDRLIEEHDTALATSEGEYRRWASQHLNIEIGVGLPSDGWAGAPFWEACSDPDLTLDDILARCDVVLVGIDGGGLDDLLGLAVLGRETGTRRWLLWNHAWAHNCVLDRRKEIASALRDFEQQKNLTFIDDDSDDDVKQVADLVMKIEESGLLPEKNAIGVDPVGIVDIIDELQAREFDVTPETGRIAGIKQGWTLSNTIKTAERRVAQGDLVHCGMPMMAWCVGNAKAEPRGNAISITKQAAGTAKIDPLMASFNAIALMAMNPDPARSVYEDEDFVV